jgi:hypothetical protein
VERSRYIALSKELHVATSAQVVTGSGGGTIPNLAQNIPNTPDKKYSAGGGVIELHITDTAIFQATQVSANGF